MSAKVYFPALCMASACSFLFSACENKTANRHDSDFTKADSLTETHLALQDTMLQVWYTMIHDDNRKISAMHNLLHELNVSVPDQREELKNYEGRLDRLTGMRYDQQSISNSEIVSEYDFASSALVTELIALAESQSEFTYNPTIQKLVDSIRAADQRVSNYRQAYDVIVLRFNRFLERNRETLVQVDRDSTLKKKPLFGMAAE